MATTIVIGIIALFWVAALVYVTYRISWGYGYTTGYAQGVKDEQKKAEEAKKSQMWNRIAGDYNEKLYGSGSESE